MRSLATCRVCGKALAAARLRQNRPISLACTAGDAGAAVASVAAAPGVALPRNSANSRLTCVWSASDLMVAHVHLHQIWRHARQNLHRVA